MFNILLVSYLGHVISREGVSTDPEKTADSSVHYARFMTSECSIGLGDGGDDSPPFVGEDYFCESAELSSSLTEFGKFVTVSLGV